MDSKITRAIYKAISEKVIEQLVWDESIQKYVLPEGFFLRVDETIARIAATDFRLPLPPRPNKVTVGISKLIENQAQEISNELTEKLLKVIQGAEKVLDN